MDVYLVGGAVRDALLERPVEDRDYVVVGSTVEDLILKGFKQVGADFPVFLHPETGEEYALARTERKSGEGYHGFSCDFSPTVTLEDDLERRDLTVNAMAMNSSGDLIDPHNGYEDLKNKTYRHVGEAFREDPLRVLRVARFMARHAHEGWKVHSTTLDLMTQISRSGELSSLTAERVWKELSRALLEPTPSAFIQTLRDCEALQFILPEVDALFGVPQPELHHPEIDTGIHTMMVMDQAARLSDRLEVRFGAMVHDLGKALTPKNEWPKHLMHEQRGVPVVEELCDRLRAPATVKKAGMIASECHLKVHRALEMKATSLVRLFNDLSLKNKPELLEDLILISEADARGRTGLEDRDYPQANYLREMAKASLDVDTKAIVAAANTEAKEAKKKAEAAQKKADQAGGERPKKKPVQSVGEKIKAKIYQASVSSVKRKMGEHKRCEMELTM